MSVLNPKAFFQEPPADRELGEVDRRVEKELGGIVARFAMDFDRAREVRRTGVGEPVVVSEPGIGTPRIDGAAS
jgi:hypothetical protein